ncbi:hypothetical protein GOV05_03090 [Candidatus Woesearchaeota archaeon]|nr:hypothetical protein [Candidatus Woesearchaeota archaeon]
MDLKALEKKAWLSCFQDGIFEIMVALIFVMSGTARIFSDYKWYIVASFFIVAPITIYLLTKKVSIPRKKVSIPRIGTIKFSKARWKRTLLTDALISAVIATLATLAFTKVITATAFGIAFVVLAVYTTIGYVFNLNIMYLLAVLTPAMFLINESTDSYNDGWGYLVVASILVVIGLIKMYKFVKRK